jgi:hypothetical protein
MAVMPRGRMGPPPRSFAADAYGCIMVRVRGTYRIQGCGATDPRPKASSPLIVIPTAPSVRSCSKLSRYGLARAKHVERLVRRPTLTAPARDGLALLRVGMKKRAFRSNKETDEGQNMRCIAEPP